MVTPGCGCENANLRGAIVAVVHETHLVLRHLDASVDRRGADALGPFRDARQHSGSQPCRLRSCAHADGMVGGGGGGAQPTRGRARRAVARHHEDPVFGHASASRRGGANTSARAWLPGVGVSGGGARAVAGPAPRGQIFVVYYADKRVMHDEVVDLATRFAYIAERYGKQDAALLGLIDRGRLRAEAADVELFTVIGPHRCPQDLGP